MNKKIIVASVTFIIIILIITSWILFSGLLSNNSPLNYYPVGDKCDIDTDCVCKSDNLDE
jgi:hypothetical protein